MCEEIDFDMDVLDDNSSDIMGLTIDYGGTGGAHPMLLYQVLQTGIILVTLVAGTMCLIHTVFVTGTRCKNFDLLFTSLIVGFLHLLTCVLMLGASENSSWSETLRGGNQHCVDYFLPATLANTTVLVTISICVIDRNVTLWVRRLFVKFAFLATIGVGLYLLYETGNDQGTDPLHQEVFFTFDTKQSTQVNFLWAVCLKSLEDARHRLVIEYCFIYSPVLTVIIGMWLVSYHKQKEGRDLGLQILASNCTEGGACEDDHSVCKENQLPIIKCFCTRLNSAFGAMLVYSAAILLVLRPAMIVYGYVTSGNIRDILPSLLQTVMYCFLCSEFLLRVVRQRTYKLRKQMIASSCVVQV